MPKAAYKAADSVCTLTVTENDLTATESFSYSLSLTPKLTSVNPSRGGTGGGTVLTISGQNFLTDPAKLVVTIAGSQCSVSSVATTQITCATNFYMYSSITAPIEVFILDNGFALNVSSYLCECKFLFNSSE